jgi:RNA polymerase subunit RPABC4/transcription elongation factor Spt4
MSDLLDTIKQGADQVLSELDQKGQLKTTIDGLRQRWSEMERRRRVSSLESQVKTLRAEMKQLTEALGLQTLSLYDAGRITLPDLSRLCERINDLRSEIGERQSVLAELKAQARAPTHNKCPQCQSLVPADAEFCPKCGSQMPGQTQVQVSAPASASNVHTVVRMRCPRCKTVLSPEAGFCPTCGVKIKRPQAQPAATRYCSTCGAETAPDARFCPVCGQAV